MQKLEPLLIFWREVRSSLDDLKDFHREAFLIISFKDIELSSQAVFYFLFKIRHRLALHSK